MLLLYWCVVVAPSQQVGQRSHTDRTDLHARDCLHFHALPGSRAGVFKWWIPMLLDYVTEMRRPGAPPMNYSSARRSQNLGFNAWRAALRERAATSNGSSV